MGSEQDEVLVHFFLRFVCNCLRNLPLKGFFLYLTPLRSYQKKTQRKYQKTVLFIFLEIGRQLLIGTYSTMPQQPVFSEFLMWVCIIGTCCRDIKHSVFSVFLPPVVHFAFLLRRKNRFNFFLQQIPSDDFLDES